jgi:hypothetical protein
VCVGSKNSSREERVRWEGCEGEGEGVLMEVLMVVITGAVACGIVQ